METAQTRSASSRKKVLTDLRRQEILEAAVKVFGQQGFAETCVEDIAEAAGLGKGTVYLYFRSKEEIYAAAVHLAVEQLHERAAEQLEAAVGLRARLAAAVSVRMTFWQGQLGLYRLLLTVGREPRHREQTHELLRAGHAHFLEILQAGREEIPAAFADDATLDAVAWGILDLVRGCNERRMDRIQDELSATTAAQDAANITAFALRQLGL